MDKLFTGSIDQLLGQGLPGIVIAVLAFVAWRFFKLYAETQEKRVTETRESVKAMEENTGALEALTTLIRDRRSL